MKKIDKSMLLVAIIIMILYIISFFLFDTGIPCLFYKITHLYCPGCGITRMFLSILKLDFYQAFRFNPFVFILLLFYLFYLIIKIIFKHFFKKDLIIPNYIIYILLLLLIIYWILRNIDYFNYLIPTIVN